MKVHVSGVGPAHNLDYKAVVNDLLRHVPPEHLAGIAYVTVSGDKPLDDDDDVLGQYFERYEGEPAVIVLYLETMRREVPWYLRRFPITWKILIAQTLFHEVGHHYQRFSHGIAKGRQEDHAENYGDYYSRKAFPGWYRLIDRMDGLRELWNRAMIHCLSLETRLVPSARAHYKLGRRYWSQEEWGLVITHMEQALELDPTYEPARHVLPQAKAHYARLTRRAWAARAYRPAREVARRTGGRAKRRKNGRRR
jgi:hypothetical protein